MKEFAIKHHTWIILIVGSLIVGLYSGWPLAAINAVIYLLLCRVITQPQLKAIPVFYMVFWTMISIHIGAGALSFLFMILGYIAGRYTTSAVLENS